MIFKNTLIDPDYFIYIFTRLEQPDYNTLKPHGLLSKTELNSLKLQEI